MWIVSSFYELKDSQTCFGWCEEGMAVEQFTLEGGEEAFAKSIIVITDGAHQWTNPGVPAALAEGQAVILAAPNGMVDDTFWLSLLNSHMQSIHHQGGVKVSGHRPTHHLAALGVHDHPQTIRRIAGEIALDQIGGRAISWISLGSPWRFAAPDIL